MSPRVGEQPENSSQFIHISISLCHNNYYRKRRAGLKSIHIAEILPLLVSVAVIVQGTIFITVQGVTLSNLNVEGCTTIAQLFWPGNIIPLYSAYRIC